MFLSVQKIGVMDSTHFPYTIEVSPVGKLFPTDPINGNMYVKEYNTRNGIFKHVFFY